MIPNTKYRKQIEIERVNEMERNIKRYTNAKAFTKNETLDVYVNGMHPSRYFEEPVKPVFLLTELSGDFMPEIVLMVVNDKNVPDTVRAQDYVYNSVKHRLDIYVDEV